MKKKKLAQLELLQGKLEQKVNDLLELADVEGLSPLCSKEYLAKGKYELENYKRRLTALTKETQDFSDGLCSYLESGLEDKQEALQKENQRKIRKKQISQKVKKKNISYLGVHI